MPLEPATNEDIKRLLELLKEYTEKLRTLCERHMVARDRRIQVITLAAVVVMTIGAVVSIWILRLPFDAHDPGEKAIIGALLFTFGTLVAGTFVISGAGTTKTLYDAHQLAITVEKLIKTSSQYGEHSRKRIADTFEFDLRLAEAEAALQVYKETFRRRLVDRFSEIDSLSAAERTLRGVGTVRPSSHEALHDRGPFP